MRIVPHSLSLWIEHHEKIVQPYALAALLEIFFDETEKAKKDTPFIPQPAPHREKSKKEVA